MKKAIFVVHGLVLLLIAAIDAQTDPPAFLSYKHNPVTYPACMPIVPDSAIVTGTPDSFTIVPALPAGLSFDKTTGTLSGTPTVPTAPANYTVTARNAAGSTTVMLAITVNMSLEPPFGLTYPINSVTFVVGAPIEPFKPTAIGNSCTASYKVKPALPAGLTLDTVTGAITGTPTMTTATASYTITASNSMGSTAVSLSITIVEAVLPWEIAYKYNPVIYVMNVPITPDTVVLPGTVDSFSVAPSLPAGLSLDKITGIISGTPTVAQVAITYTVTARNAARSGTIAVSIAVLDPSNTRADRLKVRSFDARYSSGVLRYFLPASCFVSVKYYDVKGKAIAAFVNKTQPAGWYVLPIQGASRPAGTYIQVFKAGDFENRRMVTIMR